MDILQLKVQCLETYLPRQGGGLAELKNNWMWSIVERNDLGKALTCSFAALSLARVGLVLKDDRLLIRSRTQYSIGLTSLQQALYDPELALRNETLAAIRTLSIYEVCSSAW